MKHSAIAGLFISAAMLASPVFAADEDLCNSNVQQLKDAVVTLPAISTSTKDYVEAALTRAEAAQKAGDHKKCVDETAGVLQKIKTRSPADKG